MMESIINDDLDDAILGKSSGKIHLDSANECRQAALNLASQSTKSIYIFSHDLEPQIYNQQPFLDAMRNFIIRSQHSHIKILLHDNERAQREGHRLIQLWRQLTSKIELRRTHPDYITNPECFLLADNTGYLHRKFSTDYEATVAFYSRLEAKRLSNFFNEVWEQSEPDSELRDLHI